MTVVKSVIRDFLGEVKNWCIYKVVNITDLGKKKG